MKKIACLLSILFILSCKSISDNTLGLLKGIIGCELSEGSIAKGLKEALTKGTQRAVSDLSGKGGYANNSLYRIAAPQKLRKLTRTLRQIGLGSQVDIFENKMNEAAEEACKKAAPVFLEAISEMTLEDAKKILMGSENAATQYFLEKTSVHLRSQYLPIVRRKMSEIGLVSEYNSLLKKYNSIPFSKAVNFSLEEYVTDEALKGLFGVLAKTARDIRANPAARTTELLKRVFAEQDPQQK